MLAAKLVVVGGEVKTKEVNLRLPTIIGRAREATLTLPHPLVSRNHCEIFEKEGCLHVRDLNSLNGTYVDNKKIEGTQALRPDQLLTIGTVTFRAVYDEAEIPLPTHVGAAPAPATEGQPLAETVWHAPSSQAEPGIDFSEISDIDQIDLGNNAEVSEKMLKRKTSPGKPDGGTAEPAATRPASTNRTAKPKIFARPQEKPGGTTDDSLVNALEQISGNSPATRVSPSEIDQLTHQLDTPGKRPANVESDIDIDLGNETSRPPLVGPSFLGIDPESANDDAVDPGESALDSFIRKLPR